MCRGTVLSVSTQEVCHGTVLSESTSELTVEDHRRCVVALCCQSVHRRCVMLSATSVQWGTLPTRSELVACDTDELLECGAVVFCTVTEVIRTCCKLILRHVL